MPEAVRCYTAAVPPSVPWARASIPPAAALEPATARSELRDEELLARLRGGDLEALGELYDRHAGRVRAVAAGIAPDLADDITHEVFLKLWRKSHRYAGRARLATWLYRLTINQSLDELRRRRRVLLAADLDAAASNPISASAPAATEEAIDLRTALAALPRKLRLPLVLRYYGGLDYREIARVLGCRGGTVASRLSRGLARLGARLQPKRAGKAEGS